MNPIVTTDQNHVFTTSLIVAEKFDKLHKNVLRDIENILQNCPDESFARLNFEPSKYQVTAGKNSIREEVMYNISKDGFLMLAMGFTGKKAFLWKIAFINAFNRMEAKLNELLVTEHHSMLADLYARHPQWQLTRHYVQQGYSTQTIAELQNKHRRNVQRMIARMQASGINCRRKALGVRHV
jgi:Rha family phage regulatory protein